MGYDIPLDARIRRARELTKLSNHSIDLFHRAVRLAEESGEAIPLAQVRYVYARFKTFAVINSIWRGGGLDEATTQQGEEAIALAMAAADAYARRGVIRGVAIALNEAAEAASALNDKQRRDEMCGRAEELAREYGYVDIAETALPVRSHETALEGYAAATNPPPFHREDPAHLQRHIEEVLDRARLADPEKDICRPILQRMLGDEVYLDAQREQVCQYLALLQDLRGPKIGPFDAEQPTRSVTCRVRGICLINRHRRGQPLLRQFIAAVCDNCDMRSPAATRRQYAEGDEEIYAPLLERIASEESRDN